MSHIRDDAPVVVVEKSSGGLGGFLLGVLVGGAVALLFAPQSGEETRRQLQDRGRRLRDAAGDRLDGWGEKIEDGYEEAKAKVEEGFESARRTLGETRDHARDAVDAGKSAVHSARDELERRLATSRRAREKARAGEDDETA